jgi:hypothetical protein
MSGGRWIDQATDGRVLEWVEHPVSDVMEALHAAVLARDPRPRSTDDVYDACLAVAVESDGIRWPWGVWTSVVQRFSANPDKGYRLERTPGESHAWVPWSRLTEAGSRWVELTPIAAAEAAGATRCVRVPLGVALDVVRFTSPRAGTIAVSFDAKTATRIGHCALVALRLGANNHTFVEVGRTTCTAAGASIHVDPRLAGIVVLLRTPPTGPVQIVDAHQIWGGLCRGRRPGGDEWERLVAALRLPPLARRWPRRSQSALERLRAAATAAGLPGESVERAIESRAGSLARWLVMRTLGDARPWIPAEWDAFAGTPFDDAFEAFYPGLLPMLSRAASAEQRLWMFRNRARADLADVIAAAPTATARGLDLAAELNDARITLTAAVPLLRDDSTLGREVIALIRALDDAPGTLVRPSPATVQQVLERVEEELRDRATPITSDWLDGEAPGSKQRFDDWTSARMARDSWRVNASQLLRYCSTGSWERPSCPPTSTHLLAAAAAIAEPAATDDSGPETEIARLTEMVATVLSNSRDEGDEAARAAVVNAVRRRVQGREQQWAAFWHALRETVVPARTHPTLATFCGLTAAWSAAAPSDSYPVAQRFVRIARNLDAFAHDYLKAHPHPILAPAARLRELLGLGAPELLLAARQRATALFSRITGKAGVMAPPSLNDAPIEPTAEACHSWWASVLDFERYVRRLEWLVRDLEAIAAWVRSMLERSGEGALARVLPPTADVSFAELLSVCGVWRKTQ